MARPQCDTPQVELETHYNLMIGDKLAAIFGTNVLGHSPYSMVTTCG
jgi:hypothetical protein